MGKYCGHCGAPCSEGAKFCRQCGHPLFHKKNKAPSNTLHILIQSSVIIIAIIILANTVYSVINFKEICESCSPLEFDVTLSFGLWNYTLFSFHGIGTAIDLAALIMVELSCLVFAIIRFVGSLKKEIKDSRSLATDKTGLGAASTCLSASLFISVVYILVTALNGHEIDPSWMNAYSTEQLSFMLTRAGVREELMFRMFFIGLPMMALSAIIMKDKKCWHHLFGGFGMSKSSYIFLILSSAIFGLAHYDGWGFAKVMDAGIAGLIFGYLYVEYGLYAAIIAHTANDTISSLVYLGFEFTELFLFLSLIGIGLLTIVYWIMKPNCQVINPVKLDWLPEKREGNVLDLWKRH